MARDWKTAGIASEAREGAKAKKNATSTSVGPTRMGRKPMERAVYSPGRVGNASRAMHVVVSLNRGNVVGGGQYM